jgi:uncharacterized Zn finger protein
MNAQVKEYYEEDDWKCPDCGTHEVHQGLSTEPSDPPTIWIVSCAGCGMTISDSYIGEE